MAKISGNALYYYKQFILQNYSGKDKDKLLARLKDNTKEIFDSAILSNKFYDLEIAEDLLSGVLELFGEGAVREIAEYTADRHLRGLYGFIIKFVSLKMLMNNSQKMWRKYYDTGDARIVSADDRQITLRVSGFRLTKAMKIGSSNYMARVFYRGTGKKFNPQVVKIDATTTEFHFTL